MSITLASHVAGEVAGLLATSPEDRVYRRDIRSQLPEGVVRTAVSGQRNNVGEKFRDALRAFEQSGWIARDEVAVVILDRVALWEFANG